MCTWSSQGPASISRSTPADISPAPTLLSFHGSWPLADLERHSLLRQAIGISAWLTACSDSALADLRALGQGIENRSSTILKLGWTCPSSPASFASTRPCSSARLGSFPRRGSTSPSPRWPSFESSSRRHASASRVKARSGLSSNVRPPCSVSPTRPSFWGPCSPDEIVMLVDSATVVLVPSRLEGFGLIALEGMLGLRPVVAARTGGLPEVLGESGGMLVEPDDPVELANAVKTLLGDRQRALDLATTGRQRALVKFTLRRCVDEYEVLYRRLAEGAHVN